jgi:hypothetical protein
MLHDPWNEDIGLFIKDGAFSDMEDSFEEALAQFCLAMDMPDLLSPWHGQLEGACRNMDMMIYRRMCAESLYRSWD